jgi:hypothetical protein
LWQKSVEPRKVATKVWSVARSGRLHKVVKSMEPCVVTKSVEPLKVATILWSSRKVGKRARLHREVKASSPYCGRKCEALQVVKLNNVVKSLEPALCQKSVEPRKVATKLWSSRKVRKSDRLQKEIKVWSPYCGIKCEALQVVKLNNVVKSLEPCIVAKKCGA